ncbi:MAG: DUF3794 domain-containing protein, partial [Oscillospiraceae bacterium]
TAVINDCKIIANKAICKGEVLLHTLYQSTEENCKPEIMEFSIAFSQIIDVDGITDDYEVNITVSVISLELELNSDNLNPPGCFNAQITLSAQLEACKDAKINIINDCYSTNFETCTNVTKIKIEKLVKVINQNFMTKNKVEIPQSEISCIYDISCEFCYSSWKLINEEINVCGNLEILIIAIDSQNMPVAIEKSIPIQINVGCHHPNEDIIFNPTAVATSNSYSLTSANCIDITTEINVCGIVSAFEHLNVVTGIDVNCENKKVRDEQDVLRLYFASCGECVWDIAKRFNTSISAIIEENCLDNDILSEKGMLLIPITN